MRELSELAARVAELERRFSGVLRHGTVAKVNPAKQRVRLKMGSATNGGGDFLSPWVPYAQIAGALKVHTPPTEGQQLTLMSPAGDWRQGVAVPMTFSGGNTSPSEAGDENVITFGGFTIKLDADELRISIGSTVVSITAEGVSIIGDVSIDGNVFVTENVFVNGDVLVDGDVIASNVSLVHHTHGGVASGLSNTNPPTAGGGGG